MNKIGAVAVVIGMMIGCYLLLLVAMPILTDFASTANTTITASSNLSNYPGTQGFLLSTPWILLFVPAVIGMIVIVVILKAP